MVALGKLCPDLGRTELEKLYGRIRNLGYQIELTEKAKDYIADKGYDEAYGARPLKRAIQKFVEDPLAEEIINSKLEEGDTIFVDYNKKEDDVTVKINKPSKSSKEKKEEKKEDE